MIPANGIESQCTKITNASSTSVTADVTITNLIRPLQDIFNLEIMIPPRIWPRAPPGIKTSPKRKEEEKTQLKNSQLKTVQKIHTLRQSPLL